MLSAFLLTLCVVLLCALAVTLPLVIAKMVITAILSLVDLRVGV